MPTILQNFGVYPLYMKRVHALLGAADHATIMRTILFDRVAALHMLQPVLQGDGGSFVIGGDVTSQRVWARERGMRKDVSLESILLAQIEESGAEIFYNMDPTSFSSDFARKLPGSVKHKIAWRAAPGPGVDLSGYNLVVCNFELILQSYRDQGWRAAWFYPAFDPEMTSHRASERAIDVVFVGSYSRHHRARAQVIEGLADLRTKHHVRIHLQQSRVTQLANTLLGLVPPLRKERMPVGIARVARPPLFGRELYSAFGSAKIVLNGAIDMSGPDRGNMRCWETLGCGALMLSDKGNYPPGFEDGKTMVTYSGTDDLLVQLDHLLENDCRRQVIADAGSKMIADRYSKTRQWNDFVKLL